MLNFKIQEGQDPFSDAHGCRIDNLYKNGCDLKVRFLMNIPENGC